MVVLLYVFLLFLPFYAAQDPGDGSDDGDDDPCSFISSQNCNSNGICKYCAMCLSSSCILSHTVSNTSNPAVCNASVFGGAAYDWYGYCLSSGNDSSGDYCATASECYQYRRTNNNSSTTMAWQNLTCDPNTCMLVQANGQPAPAPGGLPPPAQQGNGDDAPTASSSSSAQHGGSSGSGSGNGHHLIIALSVSCTLIVVVACCWLTRQWQRRMKPAWRRPYPASIHSTTPSSDPPSFQSTEMRRVSLSSLSRSSSLTNRHENANNDTIEPLPSYFSPDPSPPKYEQAIVTQIRGLFEDSAYQHHQQQQNTTAQAASSSIDMDHHAHGLPPPMWLPVYFTPHQNAFAVGRLRRYPPPSALASMRNHENEHPEQDMADHTPSRDT
ncbi:hypothetical protein BC940DRAFT_294897 [Gongronella butleri]|nr:hypothetical protein BC940DRAFT_294897 [Gongronella butleri]